MKNYRPIFIPDLDFEMARFRVGGLRLNQHAPEGLLGRHDHPFEQLVLVLEGKCLIEIGNKTEIGRSGSYWVIPRGAVHCFVCDRKQMPLCLVLDFFLPEEKLGLMPVPQKRLTATELTTVRKEVASLFRRKAVESRPHRFTVTGVVCEVLNATLKGAGLYEKERERMGGASIGAGSPVLRRLEHILGEPGASGLSSEQIADRLGHQKDYLNRRIKAETGLTLGQYRARHRMKKAQTLLRGGRSVSEVSSLLGFKDKNYFSRWFKEQSGMTASAWRRAQDHQEKLPGGAGEMF